MNTGLLPYLCIHILCILIPFCISNFHVNFSKFLIIYLLLYALICMVTNTMHSCISQIVKYNTKLYFHKFKLCFCPYFWWSFFKQPDHSFMTPNCLMQCPLQFSPFFLMQTAASLHFFVGGQVLLDTSASQQHRRQNVAATEAWQDLKTELKASGRKTETL